VLLKPDAIHRGIVGEILHRFERVGAKMTGLMLLVSERDTAMKHYGEDLVRRRGNVLAHYHIDFTTRPC